MTQDETRQLKQLYAKYNLQRQKMSVEELTLFLELKEKKRKSKDKAAAFKDETGSFKENAAAFKDETGSFKENAAAFKDEAGSFKENAAAFKDEAGSFKENAAAFKDETGSFKENAAAFKDETGSFKENAAAFKDETSSIEEEDDALLRQLSSPIVVPSSQAEPPPPESDFEQPDSETVQAMEEIEKQFEQPTAKKITVELSTNEDGEAQMKLSPTESADIVTAFMDSFCRELLPGLYNWLLWSKDEQREFQSISRRRRAFKKAQAAGDIPKDEVFVEEEDEIELTEKYDRIQGYIENAPLSEEQTRRLHLVWKVYFDKKKIDLSPESALFMGLGSVLAQKAAPVAQEKVLTYLQRVSDDD